MKMRIYADINSKDDDAYWRLSYNHKHFEDVAFELKLYDGIEVVVYYEDEEEEFEWDGKLYLRPLAHAPAIQWVAVVDEDTFRRLR